MSTILMVEDTIANRSLAVKLLKAASHEVIRALAGGFDGYMSKAIDVLTIAETLSRSVGDMRG